MKQTRAPHGLTRRRFLGAAGLGVAALALPACRNAMDRHLPTDAVRPNMLFLFPDQLRGDWVAPSPGLPVRTPNVEQLAAQGMRFTEAVTPSPLCAPARACLAAGVEYDRCRVPSNGVSYPLDQTTVYARLHEAGYHVMGCGKFDLHKPELDWGLDGKRLIAEWGFSDGVDNAGKWDAIRAYQRAGRPTGPYQASLARCGLLDAHVADFERRRGTQATFPTPLPDAAYCDNWIAQNGLDLLRAAPQTKPWFLQVNFAGPHSPWDITESMEQRWRGVDFPPPNHGTQLSPAHYNAVRQNYAAMIENIDRWAGRYLEAIQARGELDRTLIVFSSDHGEMLGDHDQWGKQKPYQASAGVPLVCSGPGIRPGLVCEAPATILDLTATFLDYARVPVPPDMDSRSLRPLLEGRTAQHRDHVLSGLGPWRMVFDGRYKYITGFGGEALLFDLAEDPFENRNLAADLPQTAERLRQILAQEAAG